MTTEGGIVKYIVRLIIFVCLILLSVYVLEPFISVTFKSGWIYYLIYFFSFATLILHLILFRLLQTSPRKFVAYFMAAVGIKLFVYLAILLILVFSSPERAVGTLAEFFVLYLLFTIYETYFILKLKHKQE